METYVINGVEVEYDTFDLANMELFGTEVERMKDAANAVQGVEFATFAESVAALRELCEDVLDVFDCILGEGMAKTIFGDKVNAQVVTEAYYKFVSDVTRVMSHGFSGGPSGAPAPALNREQRRAAERAQRRAEAEKSALAKRHAE